MDDYIRREAAKALIRMTFPRIEDRVDINCVLNCVPAADVAPVRHGQWMIDKGLYKCSACNRLWPELWWAESVPLEKMLKWMPNCPNCGAKMDGGTDNE